MGHPFRSTGKDTELLLPLKKTGAKIKGTCIPNMQHKRPKRLKSMLKIGKGR